MYFAQFPLIQYDNYLIRNFLIRVANDIKIRRDHLLFTPYVITDGDRADTIADKYYGHPKYYWVLYVINNLAPKDWPKTRLELDEYTEKQYGNSSSKVAYYVDDKGNKVQHIIAKEFTLDTGEIVDFYNDGSGFGAINSTFLIGTTLKAITNAEHEFLVNEAKREILILDREYLGQFVTDFQEKINDAI